MTSGLTMEMRSEVEQVLPNFIVIGAMKAGTTSLYHYLKEHDQVFMPPVKELDFFVDEANWGRGLCWYQRQFCTAGTALARGEASTKYTQYPVHDGVPERMARVLPKARLIYLVRDPIVRLRSHYQHRVLTGVEKSPPEVALLDNRLYLDCSKYAMQLERYFDHFPREQILVVTSEALRVDRRVTVQRVYEFLGIDQARVPEVIDTEFYRTAARPTYPALVLWARRLATRHMVQADLARHLAEKMFARPAHPNASSAGTPALGSDDCDVIPLELRRRLVDLLRDDITRLRRYMPADFGCWGYA